MISGLESVIIQWGKAMTRSSASNRRVRTSKVAAAILSLALLGGPLTGCALIERLGVLPIAIKTPEQAIDRISRRVRREMRRLDIPGFAIAVIEDQSILWEAYYGVENTETKRPITGNTVFRVGSITKLFTAIEVMRLRDDGLVDLDAPIEEYLPGFRVQRRFETEEPITARNLLTHRSGLPRNGTLPMWYWDPGTAVLRELVASLEDAFAVAPPWTRYKYSNIGYVTLGLLIEELRGGLWPYTMQRRLLRPIGMDSSALLSEQLPAGRTIATGYFPVNGENRRGGEYDIIYMPSGNLHATVRDLGRFLQFLFRDGRVAEAQWVGSETLREMYRPDYARAQDPQANGLGWFTDDTYLGERVVFHDGTNEGTISCIAMLPGRKLGLVVTATSDAFDGVQMEFVFDALDLLRQGLYGQGRPTDKAAPASVADPPSADAAAFAGTYIVEGERLDITSSENGLSARVSGFALPLRPESQSRFTMTHRMIPGGYFTVDFLETGDAMVKLGGTYAVFASRYPVATSLPEAWKAWLGSYDVHPRHASRYSDAEILWTTNIVFDDGLVRSLGDNKVILPMDEEYARILGGPFEGEILKRDPASGSIEWASFRFVRAGEAP
jgi:CubicO group peptidase (beta-lactamase class C family)